MLRSGGDEVEEAGAAVELGEENGGVGLRIRRRYPFKAWPNYTLIAATFSENSTPIAAHSHFPK